MNNTKSQLGFAFMFWAMYYAYVPSRLGFLTSLYNLDEWWQLPPIELINLLFVPAGIGFLTFLLLRFALKFTFKKS